MENEVSQRDGLLDSKKKENEWNHLYLQTCKLLDMMLSYPAADANASGPQSQFQSYSWAFAPSHVYYEQDCSAAEITSDYSAFGAGTDEFVPYLSRVSYCLSSHPKTKVADLERNIRVSREDLYELKKIENLWDLWNPFLCRFTVESSKNQVFYWPDTSSNSYFQRMESFLQVDFLE